MIDFFCFGFFSNFVIYKCFYVFQKCIPLFCKKVCTILPLKFKFSQRTLLTSNIFNCQIKRDTGRDCLIACQCIWTQKHSRYTY